MNVLTKCFSGLLFLLAPQAQVTEPPYWREIREFKKSDSIHFPAPNQILFVGSSSFRLWTDVQNYFPGCPIINRGFGGSNLKDVNFYFNEIIKPYHPKQIVIYCGDNDFAQEKSLPVDSVVNRLERLVGKIRSADKTVRITYVSIKPSPSRKELATKFTGANEAIRQFLKKQKNTSFADVYSKMVDKKGAPLKTIFLADSLHMNARGYAIWQEAIKGHLMK